ncbi:MAG: flagellar protein FlaG [Verrucomicrobiae bacterium]|nr:flagellar protein FlaG [Verrucomicrobiae bacterium]
MEVLRSSALEGTANHVSEAVMPVAPVVKTAGYVLEPAQKHVTEENLKDAVKQANSLSKMFDRSLKFEYRQEADIYQVSVIDTSKDEVVRKIPPDEVVRFIESIKDLFGAMIDVQA